MNIESEIAALDTMTTAQLAQRYAELHGRRPRTRHRQWLRKRIAFKIQEAKLGGLSVAAKRRLDALIAELDIPLDREEIVPQKRPNGALTPGTTVVREYQGEQVRVAVLADGFEWNGTRFGSLTAVAKAITGSHCSGPAFFGIRRRA